MRISHMLFAAALPCLVTTVTSANQDAQNVYKTAEYQIRTTWPAWDVKTTDNVYLQVEFKQIPPVSARWLIWGVELAPHPNLKVVRKKVIKDKPGEYLQLIIVRAPKPGQWRLSGTLVVSRCAKCGPIRRPVSWTFKTVK